MYRAFRPELRGEVDIPYALTRIEGLRLLDAEVDRIVGMDRGPHADQDARSALRPWQVRRLAVLSELAVLVDTMLGTAGPEWLRRPNAALCGRNPAALLVDHADALPRICCLLREEAWW